MLTAIISGLIGAIAWPLFQHFYLQRPQARFLCVWSEGTVRENTDGLGIWSDFVTANLETVACRVIAYFTLADGTPLRDLNLAYRTYDGQVSVGKQFVPENREQIYNSFELFIPISELHLSPGWNSIVFYIVVMRESSSAILARSSNFNWSYCQASYED